MDVSNGHAEAEFALVRQLFAFAIPIPIPIPIPKRQRHSVSER